MRVVDRRRHIAWQVAGDRKDWATPRALFAVLHKEFEFSMDACSSRYNATAAGVQMWAEEFDSLAVPWTGRVWCNPPYGRQVGAWVEKGFREVRRPDGPELVVMLLASRTDTSWWHDYCMKGEIRFIRGRLCFDDDRCGRCPFPSALVIFRKGQA